MYEKIMEFLNEPVAIATILWILTTVTLYVFKKSPKAKEIVEKYYPYLVEGIRRAEAVIPDETTNKSVKRFDEALKYAIILIEKHESRKLSSGEIVALSTGIPAVHEKLESDLKLHGLDPEEFPELD